MKPTNHQAIRVRADIAAMPPYSPTASLEVFSERLGRPVQEIVKLDANENPYGPSPKALEALAALDIAHIYPDPEARKLRALLAEYVGVGQEHILVGNGADELIDLTIRLIVEPGDVVLTCPPTFLMYAFDTSLAGAVPVEVPRRADFSLDLDAIERAALEHDARILFLCSPNNPDGSLLAPEELDRLLALPLLVVLDEAYIEFSGAESAARRVPTTPNLVVLRTFSKWAGLAGLRAGYGIYPLDLIEHLWKIKQPYNFNVAADAAARASLLDRETLLANVQRIVAERRRLERELAQFPFLKPYPTHTNFVLVQVRGMPAPQVKDALAAEGIIVRHYDKPGLRDHLRISTGTPTQNDRLLAALRKIGGNT